MAKDANTSTAAPNPYENLMTILEQFKVPGVDMSSFIAARHKDVEALVEANKVAYEAMQTLAQAQTEMLTQAMQGIQEAAKGLAGNKGGMPDVAKQTEVARAAWQKMLDDTKKLAEMAQTSQAAAVAGLTKRAQENIAEAQKMMTLK